MDFKSLSDPIVIVGDNAQKPGFFNKIRPPSTNFFTSKKFAAGALTVFLLFAIAGGVYLSQKPTQLEPKASEVEEIDDDQDIATDSGELDIEVGDSVYINP